MSTARVCAILCSSILLPFRFLVVQWTRCNWSVHCLFISGSFSSSLICDFRNPVSVLLLIKITVLLIFLFFIRKIFGGVRLRGNPTHTHSYQADFATETSTA